MTRGPAVTAEVTCDVAEAAGSDDVGILAVRWLDVLCLLLHDAHLSSPRRVAKHAGCLGAAVNSGGERGDWEEGKKLRCSDS